MSQKEWNLIIDIIVSVLAMVSWYFGFEAIVVGLILFFILRVSEKI